MPVSRQLPLCDSDLANLRASGLKNWTICVNGLRTEEDALVFPYRDLHGGGNCFARRRPHVPRLDEDGKPIKVTVHEARVTNVQSGTERPKLLPGYFGRCDRRAQEREPNCMRCFGPERARLRRRTNSRG
jgi:hypothetical protein